MRRFLPSRAYVVLLLGILLIVFPKIPETDTWHFYEEFLKEIGFALIVSFFIWSIFEGFTRNAENERWNERINGISKNVFMGVLGRQLPPDLINEAHDLVLSQVFIREELRITYILSDDSYQKDDGSCGKYVKMEALANFTVRNVSGSKSSHPIQVSIPNPMIKGLKDKCDVTRARVVVGDAEVDIGFAAARQAFLDQIDSAVGTHIAFKCKSVDIAANQIATISMSYTMAKEEEDSEVFQTLAPARTISVTVVDKNKGSRILRARSIHRTDLIDDTPPTGAGNYHYSLSSFVLPHQGFVIWWKRADLAVVEVAPVE